MKKYIYIGLLLGFVFGQSAENFLVARYSRDVLGRSQVGGVVINKQSTTGGHFNRTFAAEKDRDLLDGLLLAPIDRSALFVGKMLSTFIFIIIVESIVVPLFSLLYTVSLFTPLLLAVLVLGTLGYTVVGTLLAAIAIHTRSREIMLPILLFPVAVPVIIASVQASAGILEGNALGNISGPLNLVVVYDIIIFAIAIMTFDYLIEE